MLILILIDVQYSQKAIFSSNRQNHSSLGSFYPISGGIYLLPLTAI